MMTDKVTQQDFAAANNLKNVAIVIGINNYKRKEKFNPLDNAANDAIEVARVLREKYFYDVYLFTDKEPSEAAFDHPVEEPTCQKIENFLITLPIIVEGNRKEGLRTCLLFYFAGHGKAENSDTPQPKGFLIPQDGENYGKNDDEKKTWLSMDIVLQYLQKSQCHHLLTILDCCHSGAFLWGIKKRKGTVENSEFYLEHLQRYLEDPVQQLLCSAAYNEEANDGGQSVSEDSGHSPFTAALLDVLRAVEEEKATEESRHPGKKNSLSSRDLLISRGIITAHQLFTGIQSALSRYYQKPGLERLGDEFANCEFIFYNPKLDTSKLDSAPPINEENNPYRGLQAFEERHNELFQGRDSLIRELYDRLNLPATTDVKQLAKSQPLQKSAATATLPLTIVLGHSGSGKSSLVRAGLVPKLRSATQDTQEEGAKLRKAKLANHKNQWRILDTFRPGHDPFMSLARALLPIKDPELLEMLDRSNLNHYFEDVVDRHKTQKTGSPSEAQQEDIQFAQNWNGATPEARLLILTDYPDQFKDKSEDVLKLEYRIRGTLARLAQELDEDSSKEQPETFANLVKEWYKREANPRSKLLLIVDQMEELLTFDHAKKTKAKPEKTQAEPMSDRFLKLLLSALKTQAAHFHVVLTLRSDFEPRFVNSPLQEWWQYSRFSVRPMTPDELRRAIEIPAYKRYLEFQPPELVDHLLNELVGQPGALPLISFVLSELYLDLAKKQKITESGKESRAITLDKAGAASGFVGFLSRRANKEYEATDLAFKEEDERKQYQTMMRKIMLRMVTLEGGQPAKRRVSESELDYPTKGENDQCKTVLNQLVNSRLLVKGSDKGTLYYEPAHDYLIRGWDRLQQWLAEEEDSFALQQRLTPAAKDWARYITETRIFKKEKPQEQNSRKLENEKEDNKHPALEYDFQNSEAIKTDSNTIRSISQFDKPVEANTGPVFILVDALEYARRRVTKKLQERRKRNEGGDRRQEKPADYLWDDDPRIHQLSFLLDEQSWLNKLEANFVRHSIVQKQKNRTAVSALGIGVVAGITTLGLLAIWGQNKAQREQAKTATEAAANNLQNGRDLEALQNTINGSAAIDRSTRLDIPLIPTQLLKITSPLFSQPTNEQNNLREVLFQSVYHTRERNRLPLNRGNIYQITTTPRLISDELSLARMATVEEEDSVRLLNASGKQLFQLSACPKTTCEVVYSAALGVVPNNDKGQPQLATAGDDSTVRLWNIKTDGTIDGKSTAIPKPNESDSEMIQQVAYSANGTRLATIQSNFETARVVLWKQKDKKNPQSWEVITEDLLNRKDANDEERNLRIPRSIAFNPKKEQIAVVLSNNKIELWAVDSSPKQITVVDAGTDIFSLAFSQDGKTLAIGGQDGEIKLFPVADGKINIDSTSNTVVDTGQPTYSLAFLDDKQVLVVGSSDVVQRYDRNTLKPINKNLITAQQVEERQVQSVAYSPDGQLIATVGDDNSIRLWNRQGKQLARSDERPYYVRSLAFSPDGRTLIASGALPNQDSASKEKGLVEAWNISNQEPMLIQPIADYESDTFLASKNVEFVESQTIVSLDMDGTLTWLALKKDDQAQLEPLGALEGYQDLAESENFAFSPQAQQYAVVKNQTLQLWQNGKSITISGQNDAAYTSVAFSPDGRRLAAGRLDGWVQVWNIPLVIGETNSPESEVIAIARFQTYHNVVNTLAFSPDNPGRLMTGGADGQVKLWDLTQSTPDFSMLTLRKISTLAVSPAIPVSAQDANLRLSEFPSGSLLLQVWTGISQLLPGKGDVAQTVQRLAIVDTDQQFQLWDVKSDGSTKLHTTNFDSDTQTTLTQAQHLLLSPSGNVLLAISTDGTLGAKNVLNAWNVESPQLVKIVEPIPGITEAAFSQDGRILLTLSSDKLQLWDVTAKAIKPLELRPPKPKRADAQSTQASQSELRNPIDEITVNTLQRVALSPNNEKLAVLSEDKFSRGGLIEVWNLKLWEKQEFKIPQADSQLLFSPDSQLMVTVGKDEKQEVIRLWNSDSRNLKTTLELPASRCDASGKCSPWPEQVKVTFSSDGSLIAATNSEGKVSLWDTEGNLISRFNKQVKSVSFTTDNKYLVVVEPNGETTSWSIDRTDLLARACAMRQEVQQSSLDPLDLKTCLGDYSAEEDIFSTGEKLLVSSVINFSKLSGIDAYRQKDFEAAEGFLNNSLQTQPNDPESRIYFNNTKILLTGKTEENILTIAVPVPIKTNPDAAQEILRGVAQAQQEINEQGGVAIAGTDEKQPLRVVIVNDNDDSKIAKQVAQKLVDDPEVVGVVGHYGSDTTKAANKIYQQGKLVSISPVSTAVNLFNTNFPGSRTPYAFRTVPNDEKAAERLAEYVAQPQAIPERQGLKNAVVFFNSQSTYSQSIKQEFTTFFRQRGGHVEPIDLSSQDFSAAQQMQQLRQKYNPTNRDTAIVLLANSGMLDKAIDIMKKNAVQEQDIPRFPIFGGDDVYSPQVLKEAGQAAEGLVVAVPWHINRVANLAANECAFNDGSGRTFAERSRILWSADVNWRSATAYDAVMVLAKGLSQNQTREGLADVLRTTGFKACGATRSIEFQADSGDRNQPSDLVTVINKIENNIDQSRSKTGFDFEPTN